MPRLRVLSAHRFAVGLWVEGMGAAALFACAAMLCPDGAWGIPGTLYLIDLANQLTGAGSTSIAYDPLGRLQQVAASGTTQYKNWGQSGFSAGID